MAEEKTLTTREAADILRVHPYTLTGMAQRAEIEAFKVGRRWRFKHETIEAYLQGNTNQPQKQAA